ncbi:transposase [Rubellimicrobium rubrum]|uniref:Transposase n=1 Tax=Rubellimicrobium rubrum TaxID=2585369 RepID=A0A5C4MNV0_9RHOB|nr:transposase [Rubellimicrobium rubrum]
MVVMSALGTAARPRRPSPWSSDPWRTLARYRFSTDRKGQHPKDHLSGFCGWMHVDGYAGFEDLYRAGSVREVACLAHVRRKFVDGHRAQGSALAEEAIGRIAQLYAVEAEARGSPPDQRVAIRQARAKPVFEDLERWLVAQAPRHLRQEPPRYSDPLRAGPNGTAQALSRARPARDRQQRAVVRPRSADNGKRRAQHARHRPRPEEPPVRGLGGGRPRRGHRRHPERDSQAQRCRPAGLARPVPWRACLTTRSPGDDLLPWRPRAQQIRRTPTKQFGRLRIFIGYA